MSDFNINDFQAKKILNVAQKKGINVNEMQKAAQSGELDSFLQKNLSPAASQKLKNVLSDEKKTKEILESKQVSELIKKLTEGK